MTAICLIDTSIYVEILNVPKKATQNTAIFEQLTKKVTAREELFLPMATIIETGNHIGQNGDGQARRSCAARFVEQVTLALEGQTPFKPISFLKQEELTQWLGEFTEHAMRGSGLGDLSIIHDWQRLYAQNPSRRVYIWSLDAHLGGYDKAARI